jgi:hypothetical protein
MTRHLSDSELAKVEAVCAETGTDLPHLVAEAKRWKAIAGRLGLSLDSVLDALSTLEDVPRDPASADWRDVDKVAAEESLSELRYAQQAPGHERPVPPGEDRPGEPPRRESGERDT